MFTPSHITGLICAKSKKQNKINTSHKKIITDDLFKIIDSDIID